MLTPADEARLARMLRAMQLKVDLGEAPRLIRGKAITGHVFGAAIHDYWGAVGARNVAAYYRPPGL